MKWFAFKTVDGAVHVKKYFAFGDIAKICGSQIIVNTLSPFEAKSGHEAYIRAKKYLNSEETYCD